MPSQRIFRTREDLEREFFPVAFERQKQAEEAAEPDSFGRRLAKDFLSDLQRALLRERARQDRV
jgi:hypothetical protein